MRNEGHVLWAGDNSFLYRHMQLINIRAQSNKTNYTQTTREVMGFPEKRVTKEKKNRAVMRKATSGYHKQSIASMSQENITIEKRIKQLTDCCGMVYWLCFYLILNAAMPD